MRTTIKDIAREAGVSVSTVTYTLKKKGEVTKATHKRVLEAVKKLNYVPDATARSLVKGRTNSIGLITAPFSTFDFRNPYTIHVLSALSTILASDGYWLSLYMPKEMDGEFLRRFIEDAKIDGLIWFGGPIPEPMGQVLDSRRLPRISLEYGSAIRHRGSAILLEDFAGIANAVDYLYSLGHRRLLFVGGYSLEAGDGRAKACLARVSQLDGMDLKIVSGGYAEKRAFEAVSSLLDEEGLCFTAVLAASDLMAIGVLRALNVRNIGVPDMVSVMGFDDIPEAAETTPPLTTMAQRVEFLMQTACDYLFDSMGKDGDYGVLQKFVLPELVVRESTAAV